jgi:hypothetical protein
MRTLLRAGALVADCQIILADRSASARACPIEPAPHGQVSPPRQEFFLVDQSTNGTFVTVCG